MEVVAGPDAGRGVAARDGTLTVGTAEGVALRLGDPAVSRAHLELEATAEGVVLRDLGSTNGTGLGGALVREARLVSSTDLGLGHTHLRVVVDGSQGQVPISKPIGHSPRSIRLLEVEGAADRAGWRGDRRAPARCSSAPPRRTHRCVWHRSVACSPSRRRGSSMRTGRASSRWLLGLLPRAVGATRIEMVADDETQVTVHQLQQGLLVTGVVPGAMRVMKSCT